MSKIKLAVDSLFVDENCEELSDFATFDYISEIENKIVSSKVYKAKVEKAKERLVSDVKYFEYTLETNPNLKINSLNLTFTERLETVFDFRIYTKNIVGETVEIDEMRLIESDNKKHLLLNFDEVYSQELKIRLKMSEAESWKFSGAYEEYILD